MRDAVWHDFKGSLLVVKVKISTAAELWIGFIFGCCNSTGWGWQQQSQGHGLISGNTQTNKMFTLNALQVALEKVFVKWMNVIYEGLSLDMRRGALSKMKALIWRKLWHSHRHIPNISEWNILIDLTERGESQWTHFTSILSCIQSETEYSVRQKKLISYIDNWLHHKNWLLHTRSDCKFAVDCGECFSENVLTLTPFLYDFLISVEHTRWCFKMFFAWTIPLTLIFSKITTFV